MFYYSDTRCKETACGEGLIALSLCGKELSQLCIMGFFQALINLEVSLCASFITVSPLLSSQQLLDGYSQEMQSFAVNSSSLSAFCWPKKQVFVDRHFQSRSPTCLSFASTCAFDFIFANWRLIPCSDTGFRSVLGPCIVFPFLSFIWFSSEQKMQRECEQEKNG